MERWEKSFVATSVALGSTIDEAQSALAVDTSTVALVHQLRAPQKLQRAHALASAVRDIVLSVEGITLR